MRNEKQMCAVLKHNRHLELVITGEGVDEDDLESMFHELETHRSDLLTHISESESASNFVDACSLFSAWLATRGFDLIVRPTTLKAKLFMYPRLLFLLWTRR